MPRPAAASSLAAAVAFDEPLARVTFLVYEGKKHTLPPGPLKTGRAVPVEGFPKGEVARDEALTSSHAEKGVM